MNLQMIEDFDRLVKLAGIFTAPNRDSIYEGVFNKPEKGAALILAGTRFLVESGITKEELIKLCGELFYFENERHRHGDFYDQ